MDLRRGCRNLLPPGSSCLSSRSPLALCFIKDSANISRMESRNQSKVTQNDGKPLGATAGTSVLPAVPTPFPQLRSLDGIRQADSDVARYVAQIIRAHGGRADDAMRWLAEQFMVDPWTIYKWLRGDQRPPARKLNRLAELANGSVGDAIVVAS